MTELSFSYRTDHLKLELDKQSFELDVLRLDLMHPSINGNKWFKLKYHIKAYMQSNAKGIASFGGVWSNHLFATAALCNVLNITCKAYIRNDEHLETPTIQFLRKQQTQIEYVTRGQYKEIKNRNGLHNDGYYYITEGGSSSLGVKGAETILNSIDTGIYDVICCPVGTGTTLAGLINASKSHQMIVGINALKGGFFQEEIISKFVQKNNYKVFNDFHFGGFAKHTDELIQFMNNFYTENKIPTDIVYTSKMFFSIINLLQNGHLNADQKILAIHTGGLQGNLSIDKGLLLF